MARTGLRVLLLVILVTVLAGRERDAAVAGRRGVLEEVGILAALKGVVGLFVAFDKGATACVCNLVVVVAETCELARVNLR